MDKVWTIHFQIEEDSALAVAIRQESKATNNSYAAIIRKRLLESYQKEKHEQSKSSDGR